MKALKKDKGKKNKGSDAEIQTSKDKLPQENDIKLAPGIDITKNRAPSPSKKSFSRSQSQVENNLQVVPGKKGGSRGGNLLTYLLIGASFVGLIGFFLYKRK